MKHSILVLLSLCALWAPESALAGPRGGDEIRVGKRVGECFPDLRLPRLSDGVMTSLSSFRGKKVLLLGFASW